jgi:acetoin utilization deacetylase AcuC-like enzyme
MLLIGSRRFEEHVTPPGHPERMERAHVFNTLAHRWALRGGATEAPRSVTRQQLERVHGAAYLDEIQAYAGRAAMLDPDTYTSPESVEIAALAAGATVQAADHALDSGDPAFALVRPPGHHAERDRAMGFCIYNNIAVAAAHALARGLQRVAVVDIDVHHGNGTQWMFYDEPRVLYMSTHQFPFYPGTGAADETGRGAGAGFSVNAPLEMGATDADYALVYRDGIVPILTQYSPQLVLVSAGYDAHERDPLASMRVTTAGYGAIVAQLMNAARSTPIAFVTEGGYDLGALAECLEASFAAIEGVAPEALTDSSSSRGERTMEAVRAAQAPFWRGI